MAIEQPTIDNHFHTTKLDIRNAPTPPLIPFSSSINDRLDPNIIFDYDENNFDSIETNFNLGPNQTITFFQSESHSSDQFTLNNQQCLSAQYQNSTDSYILNHGNKTDSTKKISRKTKCMTPNAIAARENRKKKKDELTILRSKLNSAEQEAANYKKKYNDLKEAFKRKCEQNQYYESLWENLPSIMDIIKHMQEMPKNETPKMIKKKFNIHDSTSSNSLGVCFHVKASHDMSLKFCEFCSNGQSSVSKKKYTET